MQHRQDLQRIAFHPIGHNERGSRNDQLAAALSSAHPTHTREAYDAIHHLRRCCWVFQLHIIVSGPYMLECAVGPAHLHLRRQPATILFTLL